METNQESDTKHPTIYKVVHITGKRDIASVYVFSNEKGVDNLVGINDNIKVNYVPYQIHDDDTIEDIKLKIANAMSDKVAVEELALFYRRREKITPLSFYNSLVDINRNIMSEELSKLSKYQRQFVKPSPITNTTIKIFFENVLFDDEEGDLFDEEIELSEHNKRLNSQDSGISKRQLVYDILDKNQTEKKDIYYYDDIYNFFYNANLDGEYIVDSEFMVKNLRQTTNLRQKIVNKNNLSPIVSPYNFVDFITEENEEVGKIYNRIKEQGKEKRTDLISSKKLLLLDIGKIKDNVIYVCLLDEVLNTLKSSGLENIDQTVIHLYYPYLFQQKIDIQNYSLKREYLIEKTETLWNKNKVYNSTIDEYYDLYDRGIDITETLYNKHVDFVEKQKNDPNTKEEDVSDNEYMSSSVLKYVKKGIKSITIKVLPKSSIKIPLEDIFKQIHSSEQYPFIKFNPETIDKRINYTQEKIIRLYTGGALTEDDRKVPYYSKAMIVRLVGETTEPSCLSFSINTSKIQTTVSTTDIFLFMIDDRGVMTIQMDFVTKLLDEEYLDDHCQKYVNPILEQIQNTIEHSGYSLQRFTSLKDENLNVKVVDMTYNMEIELFKKLDLDKYSRCISAVFLDERNEGADGVQQYRFKRISSFNETNSINAFIYNKLEFGMNPNKILTLLMKNFGSSKKDEERLVEILQTLINEQERNKETTNQGQGITKKNKDYTKYIGFLTSFEIDSTKGILKVSIEKIDNIHYLNTIPVYVDTVVRLTQYPEKIKMGCVGVEKNIEPVVEEESREEEVVEGQEEEEVEEEEEEEEVEGQEEEEEEEEVEDYKKKITKDELEEKLNITMDEDDLLVSDSESEAESEEDMFGGSKNIDGMELKYFTKPRIEKYDKALLIKSGKDYNKVCAIGPSEKKQPIILSDKELEDLKKKYPNMSLENDKDVLTYGSDENHKYHYICPRFWCLKTNEVIDPNEIETDPTTGERYHNPKTGESCGKVLPNNEKKIKPGHYVFEFNNKQDKVVDGKLVPAQLYPGFNTKHVDTNGVGVCLPCCYSSFDSLRDKEAKNKCMKPEEVADVKDKSDYILENNVYPLKKSRWGYIPTSLVRLFRDLPCEIQRTVVEKDKKTLCLLRHGVEVNKKKSFLACIADTIYYPKSVPSIEEMINILVDKVLTLDNFSKYQNGNLVETFYSGENQRNKGSLLEEKYKSTKLYERVSKNGLNKKETEYFNRVINAYENFIQFLSDENSIVDHTYLWDIVASPNETLFEKGVNIILFDIPNDDPLDKVDLVCPTNHYSLNPYDKDKPSIFIVKQGQYYEPIYQYDSSTGKPLKQFGVGKKHDTKKQIDAIKNAFEYVIKPLFEYKNVCKPMNSLNINTLNKNGIVFNIKRAIYLNDLVKKLTENGFKIDTFVVNYHNKIIGLVSHKTLVSKVFKGFVPCYPSTLNDADNIEKNILDSADYVFMDNMNIWNTYNETYEFLNKLSALNIPCKPIIIVMEDGLIVGFITETNQFIQINPPTQESEINPMYKIKDIINDSYITNKDTKENIDTLLASTYGNTDDHGVMTNIDEDRVKFVNIMKMETKYFNLFRNIVRLSLSQYENNNIRTEIIDELNKEYVLLGDKRKKIAKLLKKLVENKVVFVDIDSVENQDKPSFPNKNLVTGKQNNVVYFAKLADQFVRYSAIRSYLFNMNKYVTLENITYEVNNDEMIVLQSQINQDFLKSLNAVERNEYMNMKTYDDATPFFVNDEINQLYKDTYTTKDIASIPVKEDKIVEKGIKVVVQRNIKTKETKEQAPVEEVEQATVQEKEEAPEEKEKTPVEEVELTPVQEKEKTPVEEVELPPEKEVTSEKKPEQEVEDYWKKGEDVVEVWEYDSCDIFSGSKYDLLVTKDKQQANDFLNKGKYQIITEQKQKKENKYYVKDGRYEKENGEIVKRKNPFTFEQVKKKCGDARGKYEGKTIYLFKYKEEEEHKEEEEVQKKDKPKKVKETKKIKLGGGRRKTRKNRVI
jgi:hypothetical protein